MKALKIALVIALVYAGVVASFESLLGYFQPAGQGTLVISTTDAQGQSSDRVLSQIVDKGKLYVAANHWPRSWYRQVLARPDVRVTREGKSDEYLAVPVTGKEHAGVDERHGLGLVFRILTGFPPRYFGSFRSTIRRLTLD